ncbi:MAG: hypothetical protein FJ100_19540 [Deltaproteobacteria bacterium]|nr:hypothetical protein [Deltaproteobacteria bacterium]
MGACAVAGLAGDFATSEDGAGAGADAGVAVGGWPYRQAPADQAREVLGNHRGQYAYFATGGHLGLRMADEPQRVGAWASFLAPIP